MNITPIYQVDAFTNNLFGGNPAAVMPLEDWLTDSQMQAIALENNLSETAFLVPLSEKENADFHIRWFTPKVEVPLCGHATLASAWVIFNRLNWPSDKVCFNSQSGTLVVTRRQHGWLELDFPTLAFEQTPTPLLIAEALPNAPDTAFLVANDTNYMVELDSEDAVAAASPDLSKLKALRHKGLIITAQGSDCDFVSRYFVPGAGIDEDPVTGSIHSMLAPYWAERLNKTTLKARQLSERGGELFCEVRGERVAITGRAALYMEGSVYLPFG